MRIETVFGILSTIELASAACGGAFSQCGGINFKGERCCIPGFQCRRLNDWYSYCDDGSSKPNVMKRDNNWGNQWGNWGNWNNNNNANNAANPWNNNNNNGWNNWANNNNNNGWNNWNNNNNNNNGWNNWGNNNNNGWNWNQPQQAPAQQPQQEPQQQAPAQQPQQAPAQQPQQEPQQQVPAQQAPAQNNNNSSNADEKAKWPKAQKSVKLDEPMVIKAGQTFDGLKENGVWTSYGRGVTGQGDCKDVEGGSKDAVFRLETGATLRNVILGKDSIEHVHCIGDGCTVENVWWDDVCEDALTLTGSTNTNAKFYLTGGGARDGSDKIVQHNSAGTVYIKDFEVINGGKLYRSCGNCKNGYQNVRHVVIENVNASNTGVLAGINANFGDTAIFKNVNANGGNVCYTFEGNNNGSEPKKTGNQCKGQSNCTCKK
ncbi:hypothetical protein LY90DRAFT_383785 [Neocallimastix californiae]|uniref:Probable pectate lyase F n=1 Tax=Neocallimastix californiae TaxID=1754190 RepID=A0A1Y2CWC6_9FUNG|nr:hypothetical protein LY90DRAFT_383785 [Neocallimastix californiae]|eukprot:ORY50645.1 hypothetical protein LY90DRAFT_383785 [Neocallimastix californiae]